jgi:transposase
MKFEEVFERTTRRELSQVEAASVLGMSERTFRRWRDRYEAEGAEGLYDRLSMLRIQFGMESVCQ